MTTAIEGPCAVCGVTTTQRCSACAEYSFDLFLCSREHQKLVWFVHKKVCGEKSTPFALPLLTRAEAEDIKAHLHEPLKPSEPESDTLGGHMLLPLVAMGFGSFPDMSVVIDSVTEGAGSRPELQECFPVLSILRHARAMQSLGTSPPSLTVFAAEFSDPAKCAAMLHRRDPLCTLTMFFAQLIGRIPKPPTDSPGRTLSFRVDAYTALLHQVAAVAAVDYRCRQKILAFYAAGGDCRTWGEQPADAAVLAVTSKVSTAPCKPSSTALERKTRRSQR